MPSSYTPSLRLVLPVQGELSGQWGNTINTGITSLVDAAIAGTATVAMPDSNYTLTAANEAADESRQMFIRLTGTLTAQRNVICPAVSKLYFVINDTNQAIVFKTAAGSGMAVAAGRSVMLRCNGTDVVSAVNFLEANVTGNLTGNVTGNLTGNVTGNVTGDVSGNAGTVTNGVYTTGDQTIAGTKTFSSTPIVPDQSFGFAKLQNIATARLLGRSSSGSGVVEELSALPVGVDVPAANLSGNVAAARITDALNADGTAPIYACRAWVNFDGTGTVAIRASGNVSSITDNGTGDYTVNFTTAMPDANYAFSGSVNLNSTATVGAAMERAIGRTASALRIYTGATSATPVDAITACLSIFR
jgi:hypothetical protein